MGKKKTIQNLRVGIFNDLPSQKDYGIVTGDAAPKWAQLPQEKTSGKKLSKAKTSIKKPGHNSGHRD